MWEQGETQDGCSRRAGEEAILRDAAMFRVSWAGANMGVDEMKDGTIRLYGPGREEVRVGLTVGKGQMFLGLQGRRGEIGCVDLGREDANLFAEKVTEMSGRMRRHDEPVGSTTGGGDDHTKD